MFQRHHKYWPKRDYKTPLQRQFRQQPCNIDLVTPEEHREIHAKSRETPGGMPSREYMVQTLQACRANGCSASHCVLRDRGGGENGDG